MKKDALYLFLIFLGLGILFTYLVSLTINSAIAGLEDPEDLFTIFANIGITGYFYSALSIIFDILAFISFFKVFRVK